jgi:hypothetical protein
VICETVPYTGVVEPFGVITAWSPILIFPIWASVTDACTLKEPGEMSTIAALEEVEPEAPEEPEEPVELEEPVEPEDAEPEAPPPEDEPPEPPDDPPDELALLLVPLEPLEPPPETDWPGVTLTAPTVPAKGATMLASFMFDWACVSWA